MSNHAHIHYRMHFPMHDVTSHTYYRPLLALDHAHHCGMQNIISPYACHFTCLLQITARLRPCPLSLPDELHHFYPFPDARYCFPCLLQITVRYPRPIPRRMSLPMPTTGHYWPQTMPAFTIGCITPFSDAWC